MNAFLSSLAVCIVIAVAASFMLIETFQSSSYSAFTTEGARVGDPGDNLINY